MSIIFLTSFFFYHNDINLLPRSDSHYDARNNQRKVAVPQETQVENFKVKDGSLTINWKDKHISRYSMADIESEFQRQKSEFAFIEGKISEAWTPKLWTAKECPWEESKVDFKSYMKTEGSNQSLMILLFHHTICF